MVSMRIAIYVTTWPFSPMDVSDIFLFSFMWRLSYPEQASVHNVKSPWLSVSAGSVLRDRVRMADKWFDFLTSYLMDIQCILYTDTSATAPATSYIQGAVVPLIWWIQHQFQGASASYLLDPGCARVPCGCDQCRKWCHDHYCPTQATLLQTFANY